MRWLDSITDSMDINLSKFQEIAEDRGAWHAAVHEVPKSCTQLSYLTTTTATTSEKSCRWLKVYTKILTFCQGLF